MNANWYLKSNDSYLGPYSEADLKKLIRTKIISQEYKAWSEQSGTWANLKDIARFKDSFVDYEQPTMSPPTAVFDPKAPSAPQHPDFWRYLNSQFQFKSEEMKFDEQLMAQEMRKSSVRKRVYSGLFIGIIMSFGIFLIQKNHLLRSSFQINELSALENLEIKTALEAPMSEGPVVAIELMKSDLRFPQFILASNQADQSSFTIKIEGAPDTLVGTFYFLVQADGVVSNGLFKTQNLSAVDGGPLPLGEYKVSVSCKDCKNPLLEKSFFLGGAKDANYDIQLYKYHGQVRAQAHQELTEFRQIAETIEHEIDSLTTFADRRIAGSRFESPVVSALNLTIKNWQIKSSHNQVLYYNLFVMLDNLYDSVGKNIIEVNAIKGGQASNFFTDISITRSQLLNVKAKIKELEQLPLTANGMPRTI